MCFESFFQYFSGSSVCSMHGSRRYSSRSTCTASVASSNGKRISIMSRRIFFSCAESTRKQSNEWNFSGEMERTEHIILSWLFHLVMFATCSIFSPSKASDAIYSRFTNKWHQLGAFTSIASNLPCLCEAILDHKLQSVDEAAMVLKGK